MKSQIHRKTSKRQRCLESKKKLCSSKIIYLTLLSSTIIGIAIVSFSIIRIGEINVGNIIKYRRSRCVLSQADNQAYSKMVSINAGSDVVMLKNRKNQASSTQYNADSLSMIESFNYYKKLPKASYSYNAPDSVNIGTPFTIYFLLNPTIKPQELALKHTEIIKKECPEIKQIVIADTTRWGFKMRVTLTGEDFDITPIEGKNFDGRKAVMPNQDTRWGWRVKAKNYGKALPLYLNVWCELPKKLGLPIEAVPTLTRYIRVDVTPVWLLSTYKDWIKWILGGLATAIAGAFGFYWKKKNDNK